jgi:glucosamine--fructose-6-phosphate aminotransferase (isomerizing)
LAGHACDLSVLEDGVVAQLSATGVELTSLNGSSKPIAWEPLKVVDQFAGLNGFDHYLIKEIFEQPAVVERVATDLGDGASELADEIRGAFGTFFLGCGTASYAALSGSYLFSRIARRHVNFVVGSEFAYHEHFLTDRSLVAALSQSGETADIIQSVLAARGHGARIAALVNVENSTLDRLADFSVHLKAGPERCVLSTKAYAAKVALLLLTAHIINGSESLGRDLLLRAADGIRQALAPDALTRVQLLAEQVMDARSMFLVGRGQSYPTALEAALKIKEVSYIHAEGFAGGELKHGVIALIEEGTPCMVFAPNDETRADMLSGAMELKARGGYIIGVSPEYDEVFDYYLPVADVGDASPLVSVVPAQLLGYYLALARGLDPDKPRNLAKSVTVK